MGKKFFLVTSAGMSASKWVAASLDLHPEILCTHAPAMVRIYGRDYTDAELRREHVDQVRKVHFKRSLADFMEELRNKGDAPVLGNVHGYRLNFFLTKNDPMAAMEAGVPYRLANLVRHPYAWVDSCAAHFMHMSGQIARIRYILLNSYYEHEETNEPLVKGYGLNLLDWNVLSFLNAANILHKLAAELREFPDACHVRMEDVTRNVDSFSMLVEYLSSGSLAITGEYLDSVFAQGAINTHTGQGDISEDRRYAEWPDWKRKIFDLRAEQCDLRNLYTAIGYKF